MSIELLDTSISFAKSLNNIEGNIINIVNHARKSLLFGDSDALVKKDRNPLFDVSMGSFNSTEVCELVGFYILNKVKALLGSSNACLFRKKWASHTTQKQWPYSRQIKKGHNQII